MALLVAALATGCGALRGPRVAESTSMDTAGTVSGTRLSPPSPSPFEALRQQITFDALALLDRGYQRGGKAPASGFDCSGLVSHVFAPVRPLHGSALAISQQTQSRPLNAIRPGDLLFFNTTGHPRSHVGVYVGEGKFVHATNPRTGVRMDTLSNPYYAQRLEDARTAFDD